MVSDADLHFSYLSHDFTRMCDRAEGSGPESGNLCSGLSSALVLWRWASPHNPQPPLCHLGGDTFFGKGFCGSGESGNWKSWYFLEEEYALFIKWGKSLWCVRIFDLNWF